MKSIIHIPVKHVIFPLFLICSVIMTFSTGCQQKEKTLHVDDVYIDYWDHESDSSFLNCKSEIEQNELYRSMNFNDTSSAEPYKFRFWSSFGYTKIVVDGEECGEIQLNVSKNPLITWSTMPPVLLCIFRYDPDFKSLKIFNKESKKFLDFRQSAGKSHFEKCLIDFRNEVEI